MVPAKQLKIKLVSEDGNQTFLAGKPPAGQLILNVPGKLSIARMKLLIQGQSVTLLENTTIPKSGKTVIDFIFDKPLNPGGYYPFDDYDGLAVVELYPDFKRGKMNERLAKQSFKASHTNFHRLEAGFRISTDHMRYRMPEDGFDLKHKRILPLVALAVSWMAVVFVAGLSWHYLMPVALLLLAIERRMTHNTYFAGLNNRVFMDENGQAFLEIRPRNGITKFLKASLRFRIEKLSMTSIMLERETLLDQWGRVDENVRRRSDRYLVTLPVPESGFPVSARYNNAERIVWSLTLRYPRRLLPDLVCNLEMEPEYEVEN